MADFLSSPMESYEAFSLNLLSSEDFDFPLPPSPSPPPSPNPSPSLEIMDSITINCSSNHLSNMSLQTYPTHSSPPSSRHLRVYWSHDDPQLMQDKISCAFQNLQVHHSFIGLIQLWAPVKTADGRQLLTTSNQPFTVDKGLDKYRLCSLKYQYCVDAINNLGVEEGSRIITDGAPARAFLNQTPMLFPDLMAQQPITPLVSSALDCGLTCSFLLPVFDTSRRCCVGIVECSMSSSTQLLQVFNDLNNALEKVGVKTFDVCELLPYQRICGLQHAKDEINEALKIIWHSHHLAFSHVWMSYEDENHEDGQAKRFLGLKLTDHSVNLDEEYFVWHEKCLENYNDACYRLPLKMDQVLVAGKTLEYQEPHFIQNILKLNDNNPQRLLLSLDFPCSCFVIYLRSTKTGDLDYVFEFLWSHERGNNVILFESLLLTLKRCLPSFKFASGAELGDEIDILDVENSTGSKNIYIKIFQISLKRGRQSEVEELLTPLKAKGKTTPIILSREKIELQFGQTLEEAATKLKIHVSTLKRKCKKLGIKWKGKDRLEKSQSNMNKEEDKGGVTQDIGEMFLDENILTVKVEYTCDVIKFTLPFSSATFEAIEKEICKQFKLDHVANFKLKYLDDENEWILVACDEGLKLCIKNSRNVRLRLLSRHPS